MLKQPENQGTTYFINSHTEKYGEQEVISSEQGPVAKEMVGNSRWDILGGSLLLKKVDSS